ncbi:DUF4489 domain-containing protein [Lacrimispora sp.]|uniref:DUF4489 domain-containing protein n=1 Tax=Lacrimispora sp. TaxID=2719234 RepID=UPI0028AAD8CC|nr:DUF4489 domain-containing protein [Lacrimispora sp.]
MNANEYSDGYEDRVTCYDCDHKCSECDCVCKFERIPKPLKPNRTRLKCGTSSGTLVFPVETPAGVTFTLATVNVDTKRMKQPCIQLEFTNNIITTDATIILNFQVFKQCRNQLTPIPVGPIWTFSPSTEETEGNTIGNTFSFYVCDCDTTCDECCIYSVVVTQAGITTTGITTIINSSFAAVIVDGACNY